MKRHKTGEDGKILVQMMYEEMYEEYLTEIFKAGNPERGRYKIAHEKVSIFLFLYVS